MEVPPLPAPIQQAREWAAVRDSQAAPRENPDDRKERQRKWFKYGAQTRPDTCTLHKLKPRDP